MNRQSIRRMSDIKMLNERGHLIEANDNNLICVLNGPKDSPYENKKWRITIELTKEYPFRSPSVGFLDKIFHPNVDLESGSVCLNALNQEWTPVYQLSSIIETLLPQLLLYPNPDDPLNITAAEMMLKKNNISKQKYLDEISKYPGF
tara:strand:+ start:648 stop:1088 length:441 start_codon:yes stop_codon:yes gene_type:complete